MANFTNDKKRYRAALPILSAALLVLVSASSAVNAQQPINVPIRHAETNSVTAVQFFGAQKSKDALVIVVYGGDSITINAATRAAGEALSAGYPLRGLVFGPRRDDARSVIEFYADSQLTATFLNADAGDKSRILAEITRGYRDIVRPRRVSAGGSR